MPSGPARRKPDCRRARRARATGLRRRNSCSRRERRREIAAALARLPERQRSVFMLSHYEGCTSREVSALTGLNESTVRVHLFRAIRKLRALLADDVARPGDQRGNAVSLLERLGRGHLDDAAFAACGPTARSAAAAVRASASRRAAPRAGPASTLFSDGLTNFATTRRHTPTSCSRRTPGGPAGPDLPPPRSVERPARVIAFPRFARAAHRATRTPHAGLPPPPPPASSSASASARCWICGTSARRSARRTSTARLSAPPQPAGDRGTRRGR